MTERPTLNEFVDSEKNSKESDGNSVQEVEESVQEMFGIGQIPREWDIQPLANLAEVIAGNSPPSSTYNEDENGLPFFQGNSEFGHFHPEADTWCSEPRKIAETDDILISIRAPVGDLNIADQRCCIGRGLTALRQKNTSGLYLYYHLAERKSWLSRLATGSTFKSITKGDLQNLDIPRPPLEEQRKIATVLHTVDQAIQKTEKLIAQVQRIRNGIRQDLFAYGIAESGHIRSDDQCQETYLGKTPRDWELKQVKGVCEEVVDCPHSTPEYAEDGIIVVRTSEIENGQFDPTESPRVSKKGYKERISRLKPQAGDVIFTREAPIGEAFKIPEGMKLCLGQRLMQLRTKDGVIDPDFFVELIYSDMMQNWFERSARGSTSTHINVGDMETLKIPIPSFEEQQRIDSVLGTYRKQLEAEQTYLNRLERLKQGLMQDLLSGEVRTTDVDIDIPEEVAKYG